MFNVVLDAVFYNGHDVADRYFLPGIHADSDSCKEFSCIQESRQNALRRYDLMAALLRIEINKNTDRV